MKSRGHLQCGINTGLAGFAYTNDQGTWEGFDIELIKAVTDKVSIPVIAHGGAGNFEHVYDVIKSAKVSGVGIASILHYEAIKFLPKVLAEQTKCE